VKPPQFDEVLTEDMTSTNMMEEIIKPKKKEEIKQKSQA
jgi:hypothetical protein